MGVEEDQGATAELPADKSAPASESHTRRQLITAAGRDHQFGDTPAETEAESPVEQTEGFHLFSDIPPARIAKRFKEF